jgi:hypothetical protein
MDVVFAAAGLPRALSSDMSGDADAGCFAHTGELERRLTRPSEVELGEQRARIQLSRKCIPLRTLLFTDESDATDSSDRVQHGARQRIARFEHAQLDVARVDARCGLWLMPIVRLVVEAENRAFARTYHEYRVLRGSAGQPLCEVRVGSKRG